MHDSYVRPSRDRIERPLDVHSLCNTPDMSKSDRGSFSVNRHLRKPPGWPIDPEDRATPSSDNMERPKSGHFHYSAAVGSPLPEADVSVVREM
jgi:hypothetical protein